MKCVSTPFCLGFYHAPLKHERLLSTYGLGGEHSPQSE